MAVGRRPEGWGEMRIWHLMTSRDGWSLTVEEIPDWAYYVGVAWEAACELTRGWLGGHGLPGWAWKIPVGPPRYDHTEDPADPWLENSLASKLSSFEDRVVGLAYRLGKNEVRIPLSVETARLINPKFVDDWESPDAATWSPHGDEESR